MESKFKEKRFILLPYGNMSALVTQPELSCLKAISGTKILKGDTAKDSATISNKTLSLIKKKIQFLNWNLRCLILEMCNSNTKLVPIRLLKE